MTLSLSHIFQNNVPIHICSRHVSLFQVTHELQHATVVATTFFERLAQAYFLFCVHVSFDSENAVLVDGTCHSSFLLVCLGLKGLNVVTAVHKLRIATQS